MPVEAAGDIGFVGVNSGVNPETLPAGYLARAENIITRGNKARTRPAYKSIYNAPSGHPQGITLFTPSGAKPHMVFACGGFVFTSEFPFVEYEQLPNIKFSETSARVVFQECVQTTDYDENGEFYFLSQPRNLLIMQDGNTRAAYWDGSTNRHLNPEVSGSETTVPNRDETPPGLWMAWVSDRLMVFRNNLGFASDIGNPLKFTETQYLAESRAFTFPDVVTGAVQPYADLPLLVFTRNSLTRLRVDIRQRSTWVDTPNFQQTDYNIGCVSGRSIVRSFGQIWWYSEYGVTNFNSALQLNNDSRFRYMDNEMAYSKQRLSPLIELGCATSWENYILFSVPFTDLWNSHTWVLDQMQTPEGNAAWNGWWTGVRPVQWATGDVLGAQRAFCLSRDYDGVNRVWEAFTELSGDNGCPITSYIETRQYNMEQKVNKQYLNSKLYFSELEGGADLSVYVGATRGPYDRIMQRRILADVGSIDEFIPEGVEDYRPQTRVLNTENYDRKGGCNSCGVETDLPNNIDSAFQHMVVWSGDVAVNGVQLFMETQPGMNRFDPDCQADESGDKIVNLFGCGAGATQTIYTSTETGTGEQGEISVTRTSLISQLDADDKAACALQIELVGGYIP